MSKVLPIPNAVNIANSQSHGPIHTFKSQINMKHEKDAKTVVINNQLTLKLEPNTSGTITIQFNHDFGYLPIVFYTIICDDDNFQLCHYIKQITTKGFICNVQNESPQEREISMVYKAM